MFGYDIQGAEGDMSCLAGLAGYGGNTLLYSAMHTVSWCAIGESNVHFMYPCVPSASLMIPLLPNFVHTSTALNQRTSSGLWNMKRMVALRLWILNGRPDNTI